MIISICNQKGGSGKSTLCMNLALSFASLPEKLSVGLVDIDEQQSCMDTLQNHEKDNLFLYTATERPHKIIQTLNHDIVFCDLPPHSHELMYQAAAVSSLALIPLKPSPLDIRSAVRTIDKMEIVRDKYNPNLQLRFLVNMLNPRTVMGAEIKDVLAKLYPDVPIMGTMINERQIYKQSLVRGKSVIEYNKRSPAAQEMIDLVEEILDLIKK